jgi:hypothetical protein
MRCNLYRKFAGFTHGFNGLACAIVESFRKIHNLLSSFFLNMVNSCLQYPFLKQKAKDTLKIPSKNIYVATPIWDD